MTFENSASDDFLSTFVVSNDIFDCRLPGVLFILVYFKNFQKCYTMQLSPHSLLFRDIKVDRIRA